MCKKIIQIIFCFLLSGCTSSQLVRSTIAPTRVVTKIQIPTYINSPTATAVSEDPLLESLPDAQMVEEQCLTKVENGLATLWEIKLHDTTVGYLNEMGASDCYGDNGLYSTLVAQGAASYEPNTGFLLGTDYLENVSVEFFEFLEINCHGYSILLKMLWGISFCCSRWVTISISQNRKPQGYQPGAISYSMKRFDKSLCMASKNWP